MMIELENEARVAKAKDLKAAIDQTKPVKDWGFSSNVWTSLKGNVRVYVNDKKNRPAAILIINQFGEITAQWQAGHSLTRNELCAALGIK